MTWHAKFIQFDETPGNPKSLLPARNSGKHFRDKWKRSHEFPAIEVKSLTSRRLHCPHACNALPMNTPQTSEIVSVLHQSTLAWEKIGQNTPPLLAGECHVWSFALSQPQERQQQLEQILSAAEKQRAAAFLRQPPRQQFIICRSVLRLLLGAYLAQPPANFQFKQNQFGKPSLQEPGANLHFNISHSGERGLIAIARNFEVGVDIECQRTPHDASGIARMIFSQQDLGEWLCLPEEAKTGAFYRAWTRKEALSKAMGHGLALDFPGLGVSFLPNHSPAILAMNPDRGSLQDWSLADIPTDPCYFAALAGATRELRLALWTLVD